MSQDVPEAQQQQVVELVLADRAWHAQKEGTAEQRRAGVVEARLLVLLPQVNGDQHVLRVLQSADGQLKPAPDRQRAHQTHSSRPPRSH